jgi:hypothetical protein
LAACESPPGPSALQLAQWTVGNSTPGTGGRSLSDSAFFPGSSRVGNLDRAMGLSPMCPSAITRITSRPGPLPASPDLPVASAGQLVCLQSQPTGRGAARSFPRGTHRYAAAAAASTFTLTPPTQLLGAKGPRLHRTEPIRASRETILERILGPHNRRTLCSVRAHSSPHGICLANLANCVFNSTAALVPGCRWAQRS